MNPNLSNGTRTSQANGSSKQQAHQPAEKRPAALTIGDKVYFAGTIVKAQADLHGSQVWVRPEEVAPDDCRHDHVLNTEFVEHRYSQFFTEDDYEYLLAAIKQFLGKNPADSQEASGALVGIAREWTRLKDREQIVVAINYQMRSVMELALNLIASQPPSSTQQAARLHAQALMNQAVEQLRRSESLSKQGGGK